MYMKILKNDSVAVSRSNVWHAPKSTANKKVEINPGWDISGAKFRVPGTASFAEMKSRKVELSEEVLKDRLAVLLERMATEGQLNLGSQSEELARAVYPDDKGILLDAYNELLNTKEKAAPDLSRKQLEKLIKSKAEANQLNYSAVVAHLLKKVFPGNGKMDMDALMDLLKVRNQSTIYESVLKARSRLSGGDAGKMKSALSKAEDLCKQSAESTDMLKDVFGGQAAQAAVIYKAIGEKLKHLRQQADTNITVDYNGDAAQMGVSAYALFNKQSIHLLADVASQKDQVESLMTLIHEAAHLVSRDIDDLGYYTAPGFVTASETVKINNAAHFEEVPRRLLKESLYKGLKFVPKAASSGGQMDTENIREEVSKTLDRLWKKSADVHDILATIRLQQAEKDNSKMEKYKGKLKYFSEGLGLTLHQQRNSEPVITGLDLALIEGIAHAFHLLNAKAGTMPVIQNSDMSKYEIVKATILHAMNEQRLPFSDPQKNRALFSWFDYNLGEITSMNADVVMGGPAKK